MVSTHRTKESLRAYRKVVVQNWNLFKASRVGVIGLAVMIAFLAMALAAPFMGLRDPVKWLAPAQDILNVSAYWVPPLDDVPGSFFGETGPVNTSLAFRITASADNTRVDRIYLAWGERLYAFKSWRPTQAWDSAGTSKVYIDLRPLAGGGGGNVSTNPVVVNYGDFVGSFSSGNEKYPEYFVYVGMSDGRVLAFRDTYRVSFMRNPDDENARGVTPKATLVWSTRGNGSPGVTGDDGGGVHGDPAPHFEMGNWSSPAGQPLLLADAPMRGQGAFPMRSPAFSSNATNLVVGGTEGEAPKLQVYRFPPPPATRVDHPRRASRANALDLSPHHRLHEWNGAPLRAGHRLRARGRGLAVPSVSRQPIHRWVGWAGVRPLARLGGASGWWGPAGASKRNRRSRRPRSTDGVWRDHLRRLAEPRPPCRTVG